MPSPNLLVKKTSGIGLEIGPQDGILSYDANRLPPPGRFNGVI